MNEFNTLLQQGNIWFFIPSAILLGALHGLEPGHSKTMMAAFIVAIKGTVRQAIMLGLAATVSHTTIVWLIAFGGMYISHRFTAESVEPWLQLISAIIILGTALWMFRRTWRGEQNWLQEMQEHHHEHMESQIINIGDGSLELTIVEENHQARFRVSRIKGPFWQAKEMALVVNRDDGQLERYEFADIGRCAESYNVIPEPHSFDVTLKLGTESHVREFQTRFEEHDHAELKDLTEGTAEYKDAHERAHANDIKRRFTGGKVTNWQILLFGLTGGLIPCPAAVTVLLICLQLKAFTLGATMVISFSIGLALTLVTVGVGAAISMRQVAKRWGGFSVVARKVPYLSSVLIAIVGLYMGIHGWIGVSS